MKQLQHWFERLAGYDPLAEQRLRTALQVFARTDRLDDQLAMPACWRRSARVRSGI